MVPRSRCRLCSSAAKRGQRMQRYYRDIPVYHGHISATSAYVSRPPGSGCSALEQSASRSDGATVLFQACREGKEGIVCATGAHDRQSERATIERSQWERELWQATETGDAEQRDRPRPKGNLDVVRR
jgi:hypothetical protein